MNDDTEYDQPLPTSEDPTYLAIGGCVIQEDQPRYTCHCGNDWTDVEGLWW